MYCKRHEMNGRVVFGICDKELIGRVIRDEKRVINLKEYGNFYVGNDLHILNEGNFESINAVGEKSVQFLIEKGIIEKENVVHVDGVPHAQVYRI